MTKFSHTEQAFFIILNVFYLKKKITLSMKSHLVSFLRSFWHYKKKINFHKMQLKKTVLPSPVNCNLIEDITLTLLHTETITGQNYLMNLQP